MSTRLLGPLGAFDLAPSDDPESDPLQIVADLDEVSRILSHLAQDTANWGLLQRLAREEGASEEDPLRSILHAVRNGRLRLTRVAEETRSTVVPEEEKKGPPGPAKEKRLRTLCLRFDLDPNDAASYDESFVLRSTDGSYRSEKTLKNDKRPGDGYVDLIYSGLDEDKNFTLEIYESADTPSKVVFRDCPFPDLPDLSGDRVTSPFDLQENSRGENPETDVTMTLGVPVWEIRLDDPFLGFLRKIDVEVKYEDGSKEKLKTDDSGILEVRWDRGDFVGLTFTTELKKHTMRIFPNPGDLSTPEGQWRRLVNLGCVEGAEPPKEPPSDEVLARAVEAFQAERGIAPTGIVDDATRSQLEKYGTSDQAWGEEGVALAEAFHEDDYSVNPKDAVA